jgi:hypothetical protein
MLYDNDKMNEPEHENENKNGKNHASLSQIEDELAKYETKQ